MTLFFPFACISGVAFLVIPKNGGNFTRCCCNSYLAVLFAFKYYINLYKNKKIQFAAFVFKYVGNFLLGDKVTVANLMLVNFYLL